MEENWPPKNSATSTPAFIRKKYLYVISVLVVLYVIAVVVSNYYRRSACDLTKHVSTPLSIHEVLVLKSETETLRVKVQTVRYRSADYQWNLEDTNRNVVASGTGTVEETSYGIGSFQIYHINSESAQIRTRDSTLVWSYGSPTSSGINYDPSGFKEVVVELKVDQ